MRRLLTIIPAIVISFSLSAQEIDFSVIDGPVKPVNSVGQPPSGGFGSGEHFHYLTEAGVKYSRLHDVRGTFGGNLFVDIPNLFRDFDADENDPACYDFTFTDILLQNLVKAGVEPYFRLGVTIENAHDIKSYRIYPPKDFAKWARICEHVIMHYNYGWADGFHMGITHWEIWNEPENFESPEDNEMWRGTFDEYMDLYGVASTHLKSRFPELMIGGYGSCGFSAIGEGFVKRPDCSSREENFLNCFIAFLERARKEHWPLDFFSCHSYSTPRNALRQFEFARRTLDEYGFKKTQLSVNEWLPAPSMSKLNTARQAAEVMAEMIGMQNGSVDDAELYDARMTGGTYSPLFTPETGKPRKAYYSFRAFNELKKLGYAVKAPLMPEGVYLAAATDRKGKAAVLVSNISGADWKNTLEFGKFSPNLALVIDDDNNLALLSDTSVLHNNSVMLIYLSR